MPRVIGHFNHWPIEESRAISLGNRKIGLGLMGFADALMLLGMRYDSDKALVFADKLSEFLQRSAHRASAALSRERGSFPYWKGSVWDTDHHSPMRNATCTTIAPTGSISIIAQCSSGIEPIYSVVLKRVALNGSEFTQIHPFFEALGTRQGWMTERVRESLLSGESVHIIKEIPPALASLFTGAHQISPQWHVRMQVAFQAHTDNAVSKTVNLPPHATVQDVESVFKLAYALGSKGITVYRDRSRPGQVLSAINRR